MGNKIGNLLGKTRQLSTPIEVQVCTMYFREELIFRSIIVLTLSPPVVLNSEMQSDVLASTGKYCEHLRHTAKKFLRRNNRTHIPAAATLDSSVPAYSVLE